MLLKSSNEEHVPAAQEAVCAHYVQKYPQVTSYLTCQHQIACSYYLIWTQKKPDFIIVHFWGNSFKVQLGQRYKQAG